MSTVVHTELRDDLDGGLAEVTRRFAVDGKLYEIDLSAANSARFDKDLADWIAHARPGVPGDGKKKKRTAADRNRSADIRAWAKTKGIPVGEKGRIPGSVIADYDTER